MQRRLMMVLAIIAVEAAAMVNAITIEDLVQPHEFDIQPEVLQPGDASFQLVHLDTSIHFYSEVYDHIYVNTNGILTFGTEFPDFLNQPFPLEYPSIAPFYTNVDTSSADDRTTQITYFESNNPDLLHQLGSDLFDAFPDDADFEAAAAFVVTWSSVGHFQAQNDRQNTFEVIILSSLDKSYVQFRYPRGGLNWIQADIGESGLIDVRAQAGFISEDGRHMTVPGSGKDNVKYLSALSNHNRQGSWWFLVGPLSYDANVVQPSDYPSDAGSAALAALTNPEAAAAGSKPTCATHSLKCHVTAICEDTARGFCCKCRPNYYGNGFNCLQKDTSVRVLGRVSGRLGDETIDTQAQAFVTIADGRTYAALTPLSPSAGVRLQLLHLLAAPIGWLFAVPTDGAPNGFQLTGGRMNYTANVRFHGSERQLEVKQQFSGMNVWDQLEVAIELNGDLPDMSAGATVGFPDLVDEFVYSAETTLRSIGTSQVTVNGVELAYSVIQQIDFEKCPYVDETVPYTDRPVLFSKAFKTTAVYTVPENALRIGQTNKVTTHRDSSPCNDGTATCGQNTICLSTGNDLYDCVCKNGFMPTEDDAYSCLDIDECADAAHICHPDANCLNNPGGYSCVCAAGFEGNGFDCAAVHPYADAHFDNSSTTTTTTTATAVLSSPSPNTQQYVPEDNYDPGAVGPSTERRDDQDDVEQPDVLAPEPSSQCERCSAFAECFDTRCICHDGYEGDGEQCEPLCRAGEELIDGRCLSRWETSGSAEEEEETELEPFCHHGGCTCPTGYVLRSKTNAKHLTCFIISSGKNQDTDSVAGPSSESLESDRLPCDAENNCSPNADCQWIEADLQNKCVCRTGYEGDGYDCAAVSCLIDNFCHERGQCAYDEAAGKSVCQCQPGYEGDGVRQCQPAPECRTSHDCPENAECVAGICDCRDGYERDLGDFCVLSGSCGGAYCAPNAQCSYDAVEHISYCVCVSPFNSGNPLIKCEYVPPPCNVQNNCGLNAECAPNYRDASIYECVCAAGYNGDGFTCAPEENCANTPSLCHPLATCVSTTVGLQCICNSGYVGNGAQCDAPPQFDSEFLLLSRGLSTIRVPFNGKNSKPIFMSHLIMGLDKDCTKGRVYWSDITAKCIMSAAYNGSDKRPFITEDILSPEGVAVDWISRRLYWTDSAKDTVEVASLDDPRQRAVVVRKDLVNPRGIAVDPRQRKIYWSDWNRVAPKIEWANLDGSEREVLLAHPQVELPNYVALSPNSGELCFTDAGTRKVECVDAYRREVRTIAANLTYPFGLAVTAANYYWTDWTTKKIETVDQLGARLPAIFVPIFSNHKMYGLTAITNDCPLFYSPCQINNGDCPTNRLCLANDTAAGGRSCVCHDADLQCSDSDDPDSYQ